MRTTASTHSTDSAPKTAATKGGASNRGAASLSARAKARNEASITLARQAKAVGIAMGKRRREAEERQATATAEKRQEAERRLLTRCQMADKAQALRGMADTRIRDAKASVTATTYYVLRWSDGSRLGKLRLVDDSESCALVTFMECCKASPNLHWDLHEHTTAEDGADTSRRLILYRDGITTA